jgi:hypothetical protein
MPLLTSLSAANLGLSAKAQYGVTTLQYPGEFTFQMLGGGAGGPTSQAGGGGGAGMFFQGKIYANTWPYNSQTYKIFIGAGGVGRSTSTANSTILEGGVLINGTTYNQYISYYGGYGASYNVPALSSFGSTGGGAYKAGNTKWAAGFKQYFYPGNVYDGIVYANSGGEAYDYYYITSAGGGGGAGGAGSPGVSNNLAGIGGPGMLDWTGSYVCYGGGGIAYAGGFPIPIGHPTLAPKTASSYFGGDTPAAVLASPSGLANTGGGGSWGGRGGSGKFILRYPDTFREMDDATGTYTTYTSGGFRYYVWTGSGTFRLAAPTI